MKVPFSFIIFSENNVTMLNQKTLILKYNFSIRTIVYFIRMFHFPQNSTRCIVRTKKFNIIILTINIKRLKFDILFLKFDKMNNE